LKGSELIDSIKRFKKGNKIVTKSQIEVCKVIVMTRFYPLFFGIFIIFICACNITKTGKKLGSGLRKGIEGVELDTTMIANTSQAAVRAALEEALRKEVGLEIQARLDPILGQLIDSLNVASLGFTANLRSDETAEWLQKQTDALSRQLLTMATGLREELIGEETKRLAQTFIREAVVSELDAFFSTLISNLTTDDNLENLTVFRTRLSAETDALIASALLKASEEFERNFDSKIKDYIEEVKTVTGDTGQKVDVVVDNTARNARNLLALIFGGLGGLLLLYGAIRYYLSMVKYKDMIKILTDNIDKIGSQAEYDRLVGNIRKNMNIKGLNHDLEAILREQNLDEQPEWDDKDQQVLRLISKYLKEKKGIEDVAILEAEARELGLDDHLESVINRTV